MSNIKIIAERSDIVAIADAIRSKTGLTNEMTLGEMINNIKNISVGSGGSGGGSNVTITDDGNGNVTISGVTITDDGNGNVTIGLE